MGVFTKKKLARFYTLGEKFFRTRKRLGISLLETEKNTKISVKYLEALERNDYGVLPDMVYTRGFIVRYANYLNLKIENVLLLYERDLTNLQQAVSLKPTDKSRPSLIRPNVADEILSNPNRFTITPQLVWGTSIGFGLLSVFGYIWLQVASFAAAPPLEIVSPQGELKVSVETVEIRGQTDGDAILEINDQPVAVDETGIFRQEIKLMDGVNAIKISAKNKVDKETTKIIQVLADIDGEEARSDSN